MVKDILLDTNHDILLKDGNLVFGDASAQNLEVILILNVGELKWNPLLGCGMIRLTQGRINPQVVIRDIELVLKADGWKNIKVTIIGGDITVDATR